MKKIYLKTNHCVAKYSDVNYGHVKFRFIVLQYKPLTVIKKKLEEQKTAI